MSRYTKTKAFLGLASTLLETPRKMEDIFYSITKRNLKNVAVRFIDDDGKIRKYRYSTFRAHTYAHASVISDILFDAPKHKSVILKLPNSNHWGEIFWAILMSGYRPLLIDAKLNKDNVENLAAQAHAVAIICDDPYEYSFLKISLDDILTGDKNYSFSPEWENEVIFCSSGTTGDVKMMVYNGENLVHQICSSVDMPEETMDMMYPKCYGKVNILAMIPFHHIFGFVAVFLWFTFYGKTLVFPASNASSDILYISQKCKVSHVFSVPLFWDSLARNITRRMALEGEDKVDFLDKMIGYNTGRISGKEAGLAANGKAKEFLQNNLLGHHVRYCISGGGFLSKETLTTINGLGYPLYNGYGMTEIGVTSVELSPEVEVRLKGRIGHPLHGIEYKVSDNGELLVKSNITHVKEIIGGEEKQTVLTDGYFHTGDIVEADAQNGFYMKGRIKDIIVNADGENIFPDELELYFKELPGVKNLSILGIAKSNSKDENVVMVLELDNQVTESEMVKLQNTINEINLPHNVKIGNIYLAKGSLPVANNMKVKRYVIKKAIESDSHDYVLINAKKAVKSFDGFDAQTIADILEPVRESFSKVLLLPVFKIDDAGHWINDLGGDSMSYVELVRELQEKFNVVIPEELYGQLTCVNDFVLEIATLKKADLNKPKAK